MNATFIRNPKETARAQFPVVPACRYTYFTPTRGFNLTGMRVSPGQSLRVTFTLAAPGAAAKCVAPDAALLPRLMLHRTGLSCSTARRAAPAAVSLQQLSTVSATCQGGEYAAELTVPATFTGKCLGIAVKLADGSTRRALLQVV
jgi:hypothetical protein